MTQLKNGNSVSRGETVAADVCVIGGGAAGITIARALANSNLHVVLLESGTTTFETPTQDLYTGTSSGDTYDVNTSRLRFLGGSTNHWAGWCRPLDPTDFEARPWVRNSGWPITRQDLDPYYAKALPLVDIAVEPFDRDYWLKTRTDARVLPLLENDVMTTAVFRFSQGPVHFGDRFRKDLERAANVDVYLESNVVNIAMTNDAASVTHVDVATLKGNRFKVAAREYVLALGGIENARMLLASRDVRATGVANDHDLVGRYFMDHPEGHVGVLMLSGQPPDNFLGGRIDLLRTVVTFNAKVFEREQMNAIAFVVGTTEPLAVNGKIDSRDVAAVLQAIEGGASIPYELYLRGEPEPNPDSRVTLTDKRDALGLPRLDLRWQLGPDDRARYRHAIELLAKQFGSKGVGWVRIEPADFGQPKSEVFYGAHHMGTTRMHADPRKGVVDAHCRAHGLSNLSIAGSSVFPAVGYSNPTLTIVALALRIADNVRASLA